MAHYIRCNTRITVHTRGDMNNNSGRIMVWRNKHIQYNCICFTTQYICM